MATGDYCSLTELKAELWPDGETPDALNDTQLARIITQVARDIDAYTATSFYDSGADETRYFTARDSEQVWIDPATTVTSVATDDAMDRTYSYTWTANVDYELWPYNSTAMRGQPYARIDRAPLGRFAFPCGPRGVKVIARYCYHAAATIAAVLPDIKTVALLKAVRMFKRKDAPFGVLGATDNQIIYVPGFDPDERRILDNYRQRYT